MITAQEKRRPERGHGYRKGLRETSRKSCATLSHKGQFFSYDAIVAGMLFVILLTILYVYWTSMRSLVFTQIDDMFRVAIDVSSLLLTPGNPADWNASTVKQIGLTALPNSMTIDPNKVEQLRAMTTDADYDRVRSMIGAGSYMFFITIGNRSIGINATSIASGKFSVTRPVIYNGMAENLTVMIWSNFTG